MPLTSFYAALTGLNNNAMAINVIGNNLANTNTTAFKSGKVSFSELLAGAASGVSDNGTPIQYGVGSFISGISPVLTQGSISSTGRSIDAAINGNGFFVVSTGQGQGFTRDGAFSYTEYGELINTEGFRILGYQAVNGVINSGSALTPIVIQKGASIAPRATENVGIGINLDSRAVAGTSYATAVQAYDSLGTVHTISISFGKTAAGQWSWNATIPAADVGGLTTDPPVTIGTGNMTFDSYGRMTSPAANPVLNITGLASGAADMAVNFNLWNQTGDPLITGYASTSTVSSTSRDGSASSVLKDVTIDSSGVIIGTYDDGQVMPLAQLAIADFANVEGLVKYKGGTYVPFISSGEPSIGIAGVGGRGTIVGSSLEKSNVDIANEFINLIVAQRGYQANSRVITTSDELYQEAINLKR
jgi:flagellar hook protein FlgE